MLTIQFSRLSPTKLYADIANLLFLLRCDKLRSKFKKKKEGGMKVETVKTRVVRAGEISIQKLLAESLSTENLPEKSVVVISSKVVALCENRVVKIGDIDKEELIKQESDFYIDADFSEHGYHFTIKYGSLSASAGIDESNGDNNYVLWPVDSQKSANEIRAFLSRKFDRKDIGVVIADSTSYPLRRGTVGIMVAWSGFRALKDWRGKPDLFGRNFNVSVQAIGNNLAIAGNLVMGEGDEQTPIAVISNVPFVEFQNNDPTPDEIKETFVSRSEDLYAPFLNLAPWIEGGGGYKAP